MAVPQAQKPAPSVQAPKSALPRMAVPAPRPVREPLVPQSGDLDREERELSAAIAVSIASAALHPKAPAPPIAASASIPVATSAAEEAELAAAIEASLRESIAKQPATDSPTVDAAIPSAVTRASDSTVSAVAREADEKMEVHPAALTVEASSVTTPPAAADVHTSMPTTATAASGLTEYANATFYAHLTVPRSVTLDDGGFVPVAGGTAEPLAPTAVARLLSCLCRMINPTTVLRAHCRLCQVHSLHPYSPSP